MSVASKAYLINVSLSTLVPNIYIYIYIQQGSNRKTMASQKCCQSNPYQNNSICFNCWLASQLNNYKSVDTKVINITNAFKQPSTHAPALRLLNLKKVNCYSQYVHFENAIVIGTRRLFEVTNVHNLFLSQKI